MRLNPLADPAQAARQLRETAGRGAPGGSLTILRDEHLINAYLAWAHDLERLIRNYFVEPDLDGLYSTRYWQIRAQGPTAPRLYETVIQEATWQFDRLTAVADDLGERVERLAGDPTATFAVLDTNVFLHCRPLSDFEWGFVAAGSVRVIVPLRVIEELDARRRDRNAEICDRARAGIRLLRDHLTDLSGPRGHLNEHATIEAFVPAGRRDEVVSADTEILETAQELQQFTQRPTLIVTADYGMQLRAAASGLLVSEVPPDYQL
jgi:hypothetical protein